MNLKNGLILILALLLLAGCKQEADLDSQPEIMYGQDVCEECGMIISETRHAASYTAVSGEVRRFDDIGGMLQYDQRVNEDVHVYWVHDFSTEEWINAEEATFVLDNNLVTPMGWGVIAFSTTADAEAYAAENGGVVATYAALQEEIKSGALDPTSLDSHDHDNMDHEDMSDDEMEHENMDDGEMDHDDMEHDHDTTDE